MSVSIALRREGRKGPVWWGLITYWTVTCFMFTQETGAAKLNSPDPVCSARQSCRAQACLSDREYADDSETSFTIDFGMTFAPHARYGPGHIAMTLLQAGTMSA